MLAYPVGKSRHTTIFEQLMYSENIKKITSHRSEMKTEKMQVPVVFHVQDQLMPN